MSFGDMNRVKEPWTLALRDRLSDRFGIELASEATQLGGGDESAIFVVESDRGALVVRIAPAWKTDDELAWVHSLTRHVAEHVPEAVAPIAAPDGSTILRHNGYPVSLFRSVEGEMMSDTDDQAFESGHLLARVHSSLATWSGRNLPRPPYDPRSYMGRPQVPLPDELTDDELESWFESLDGSREPRGLIHGDFYQRNLLVKDGTIVGLLDWDEAHEDFIAQEIAWSMWEVSYDDDTETMDDEDANDFIDGYIAGGGTLSSHFGATAVNFIRWRLRDELQRQLTAKALGEPFDEEYFEWERTAFLRRHAWTSSSNSS